MRHERRTHRTLVRDMICYPDYVDNEVAKNKVLRLEMDKFSVLIREIRDLAENVDSHLRGTLSGVGQRLQRVADSIALQADVYLEEQIAEFDAEEDEEEDDPERKDPKNATADVTQIAPSCVHKPLPLIVEAPRGAVPPSISTLKKALCRYVDYHGDDSSRRLVYLFEAIAGVRYLSEVPVERWATLLASAQSDMQNHSERQDD